MPAKKPTTKKPDLTTRRRARKSASRKTKPVARKTGKKAAKAAGPTILLVNMIPRSMSGEEHQDSEPSIAVNPSNPLQIAGSAFTPDPAGGPLAPIYVSNDGGNTWTLNSIVPGGNRTTGTGDITLKFSRTNSTLYAGILRGDSKTTRLNILRTKNFAAAKPMEVLVDRFNVDQPYMQVSNVTKGAGKGKDRIYVGTNDTSLSGSATIEQSLDGAAAKPAFRKIRIESRQTAGQDGPPVRPSIHSDGTAYAIYHSWRTFNNNTGLGTADVVVVRDDQGATGLKPFRDLIDSQDKRVGVRVAQNTKFNFSGFLGEQRTGGDVALAVDPSDSDRVYIAYNDDQGAFYMLHVLRSTDRGKTWSRDLRTLRNALNPALAINDAGKVGFLYQQLTGTGAGQRWETKLEFTTNGANWNALTLAKVPAAPARKFDPYLGDYAQLMSLDKDFYGVFSANNAPKKTNFPNGVLYQRNVDWTKATLLDIDNTSAVRASIDPFFVKVSG